MGRGGWGGGCAAPFLRVKETIDGFAQRGQKLLVSNNCLKIVHLVNFHVIKCAFNEEECRIFVPSVAVDLVKLFYELFPFIRQHGGCLSSPGFR